MKKFLTTVEYNKDLKERRKKAGLCIRCGKPLDDSFVTCSVCRLKKDCRIKIEKNVVVLKVKFQKRKKAN